MEKELLNTFDKELLLKDIYARLSYGVKGIVEDGIKVTTPSEWPVEKSIEFSMRYMVIKNGWKPYLFPMSSLTEEQEREIVSITYSNHNDMVIASLTIDWLNKNHFDYRGLIEKSLALDATGLDIY